MPRLYATNPARLAIALQLLEHLDGVARPARRHIDVRPQELDVVRDLRGHRTLDSRQRLLRIVELILLEVDAGEPERGLVSYGFIDGAFEHRLDGAPCAVVHAVVELEVADREFGVVDVIVQRIEFGLVETVVHGEFGVEPLDCIEELSLVGVIERLAEIEVPQVSGPSAGRAASTRARPSPISRRAARIDYHSPSAIGVLPEPIRPVSVPPALASLPCGR